VAVRRRRACRRGGLYSQVPRHTASGRVRLPLLGRRMELRGMMRGAAPFLSCRRSRWRAASGAQVVSSPHREQARTAVPVACLNLGGESPTGTSSVEVLTGTEPTGNRQGRTTTCMPCCADWNRFGWLPCRADHRGAADPGVPMVRPRPLPSWGSAAVRGSSGPCAGTPVSRRGPTRVPDRGHAAPSAVLGPPGAPRWSLGPRPVPSSGTPAEGAGRITRAARRRSRRNAILRGLSAHMPADRLSCNVSARAPLLFDVGSRTC